MSPQLSNFIDEVIVPNLLELWLREQAEARRRTDAAAQTAPEATDATEPEQPIEEARP